jgi:uncharacterized damage-inducible protein DinB
VTPDERIARLQNGVKQLLDDVRNLPDEALYRDPPDGEWSVMRNLAHVAEMLPYWAHQAEAIARAPGEPFGRTHDDPQRIGAIEEHSDDVLEETVTRIEASAAECLEVLRALPPDAWSKAGEHPSRGTMTVEQMVDAFIVGHVAAHVRQVEEALEAVEANPSG